MIDIEGLGSPEGFEFRRGPAPHRMLGGGPAATASIFKNESLALEARFRP